MKKQTVSLSLIFVFFVFFLTKTNATTYTVTTTAFTGVGSINDAVNNANGNPGKDTILFQLTGTAPFTIIMTIELVITDDILVDGTSQIGYNSLIPAPVVELRNSPAMAFIVNTGSLDVRALALNNCNAGGIILQTNNNKVTGCYIGLGLDGITANGNNSHGITINSSSAGNIIGGTIPAQRNVISGNNGGHGIIVSTSSGNYILGNYIGTDASGSVAVLNSYMGIQMDNSSNNTIGGNSLDSSNIISFNGQNGIQISGNTNRIVGNTISSNEQNGIQISGNFNGIIGNSISYNGVTASPTVAPKGGGILLSGNSNIISEDSIFANGSDGILINSGNSNIISANMISLNGSIKPLPIGSIGNGITISGSNANTITGNNIGLKIDKSTAWGNIVHGVYLINSNNNQVGGIGASQGNIISSNGSIGINVENSQNTIIKSNIIGTSQNTQIARGNLANGIQLTNCPYTTIGGNHLTEGNIISANAGAGIDFEGNGSKKTIIKGNYIGTDNTGKLALGNGAIGIIIKSDSCIIGSTVAGEGNVIVDSKASNGCGILMANASATIVKGNLIGVGADGTTPLPNTWDGINISVEINGDSAIDNIIRNNIIAYNLNNGISVGKSVGATIDNKEYNNDLRFNSIFCNKQLGIALDLANTLDEGNNGKKAPLINNALSTSSKIVGIANGLLPTDSVDIYEMVDCSNCDLNPQGKTYIATVLPDAAGNWSYDNGSPITGTFIATATDAQKNTSQFSLCFTPCKAVATVSPTTFTVQLEMGSSAPVTLTSSSTFSTINPTPGKVFWSLNTPDTTGTALFSTAASVNFNFSVAGGTGDHGPGLYTVYLIAKQSGCMDTTEAKLNVFFIPNIITPNGDHHNDQWAVGNAAGQFDAKIYNRWGDLVYSKSDYTNEWSGDGLSDGVYYYLLEDKTQSKKSFKGWVQIMK